MKFQKKTDAIMVVVEAVGVLVKVHVEELVLPAVQGRAVAVVKQLVLMDVMQDLDTVGRFL